MPRLSRPVPADLDAAQRAVLHAIVTGRRATQSPTWHLVDDDGRPRGPFAAMVAAPSIGGALAMLGESLRFDTGLPDRVREFAILLVAAHRDSAFEWASHVELALAAQVPSDAITALARGELEELDDPELETVRRFVGTLLTNRAVDDETFAAARATFGESGTVELVTLTGTYELLALLLAVFHDPDHPDELT